MFDIQKETRGNVIVLTLKGRLDAQTAGIMTPIVTEMVDSKITNIVFDLLELTLIDSSGIGAIVAVYKTTKSQNGDTKISGLNAQPLEVFKLLKLDKVIHMCGSVEQALSSFK
ncbi:MAG: STAS domain-containing protein [Planctomycetes bacterium]|nr:STAS domain-containing protein [Planctomycetota bacterium]